MSFISKHPMTAAMIGAGALVCGALAFHLLSSKVSGGSSLSEVMDEIQALGQPQFNAQGFLEFEYYRLLFAIINKHAKLSFADEKKNMTETRRSAMKAGDTGKYREIVQEMIQREERGFQEMLNEATSYIGMSEDQFMMMHASYMQNPMTQQVLM